MIKGVAWSRLFKHITMFDVSLINGELFIANSAQPDNKFTAPLPESMVDEIKKRTSWDSITSEGFFSCNISLKGYDHLMSGGKAVFCTNSSLKLPNDTTLYTIIKFLPNPVAGEYLNIGLIAIDNECAVCWISTNWERINAFAAGIEHSEDALTNLKAFLEDFVSAIDRVDIAQLKEMVNGGCHFVQFTPLRPSKRSALGLVENLANESFPT